MLAGGMLDEPVLVVSEGLNALARPLFGVKRYEQKFEVWDGGGQVVGHVEPTFRDTALDKLFRFAFAVVFTSSTRRGVLDYRVLDKLGGTVLALEVRGQVLLVKDSAGGLVGAVANKSSSGGPLEAAFYAEPPATKLFQKDPEAIGSLRDEVDRPPFEYELKDASGAVFARVSNSEDRRNVLEMVDGAAPRLRALALGFTCALVDRVWLQVPQAAGPGG